MRAPQRTSPPADTRDPRPGPRTDGAAERAREARPLVRVAVPAPLAEGLDYVWTEPGERPAPGCRVRVPLGHRERVGIVVDHPESSRIEHERLKPVRAALDAAPVISRELLDTLSWAARYYHHPIGEVVSHALPAALRGAKPLPRATETRIALTRTGAAAEPEAAAPRAPRQAALLRLLAAGPRRSADVAAAGFSRDVVKRLEARGLIVVETRPVADDTRRAPTPAEPPVALTREQRHVLDGIRGAPDGFHAWLLHGATGSGKTEVYLRLIADALERGRQTLLLVPEIGLTPQLVERLRERFSDDVAVLHSGLSEKRRLDAWLGAARGTARLVVGTRSAVFAPLPAAGLVVVDEEHDPSFKQQSGFRYSARDLAVVRAQRLDVPVLLASATPSLESINNVRTGRYSGLAMPTRIGAGGAPAIRIVDMNRHASRQGLSTPLVSAMTRHLEAGNQVLLFLNRRGFAPALFCPRCAVAEACERCDAHLTVHARAGRLRCHHCGVEKPLTWACPSCGDERIGVGAGTQRVADELKAVFAERTITRLDRDVTSSSGRLAAVLDSVASGDTDILVGTQMLTKGHDFPRVTLVGVLNADQGLFGTDFRSDERLAQTIVQVAGRAGRRAESGEVLIQTHHPGHPLLERLVRDGYSAYAELALAEREAAGWPPFSHLALWRAEAAQRDAVYAFLDRLRAHAAEAAGDVSLLGPAADPMERKAGRYRAQLLFQATRRASLHALVDTCLGALKEWKESRRVRWSIDIDPNEL